MFLKDPLIGDGSIYLQNATLPLKIIVGIATLYVCVSALVVDGLLLGIYGLVGSNFMWWSKIEFLGYLDESFSFLFIYWFIYWQMLKKSWLF